MLNTFQWNLSHDYLVGIDDVSVTDLLLIRT